MRFHYRLPRILLLAIALDGCMSWHTSTVDPVTLIARDHPNTIVVTRQDRSRVTLYLPVVDGDSLRGRRERHAKAVALSDVSSVSVQKTNAGRTVALVLLTAAFVVGAIGVASWDGPFDGGFSF